MKIPVKSMTVPVTFLILAMGATALSAETMEESSVRASRIESPSTEVAYGDLDLSSTEGRESLERRLRHAAKGVCEHESYRRTGSLSHYSKTRACYENALAGALSDVYGSEAVAMTE